MKNISVHLQQFIVDSLHPNTLAGQRISSNEFEKWKSFISQEIEKLYLQTLRANFNGRNSTEWYVAGVIGHVTELSDIVNGYLIKYARLWQNHGAASEIKQSYIFTCQAFESFIEALVKKYPAIGAGTRFPDHSLFNVKTRLKNDLKKVRHHLDINNIDSGLNDVVTEGIYHIVQQNNLLRGHELYLRRLMADIIKHPFRSSQDCIDYLIINDFNLPEFFLFCVDTWSKRLIEMDGMFEQREMLLDVKSHLFDISFAHGLKFPFTHDRLYNELNKFLTEKYALVKEKLKISRQFALVDGQNSRAKRIMVNLSVAQLGLFIRVQVEKGILMKEHIGELFAFYARHFYTPNTNFISPESLQKKSSDVEHATAIKLKAQLISMINWINTNYNLSNFN